MARLEIACFNAESMLIAQRSGADRIEFCADYDLGGVTPDFEVLNQVRPQIAIPVFAMIRPRSGNFIYSDVEFEQMKSDIKKFKSVADGFVFGILTSDNKIDVRRNSELVKLADLPCTFHRAFDEVEDRDSALEDVVRCKFQNILTSGGSGNAIDNLGNLTQLVAKANGRVTIMPGGGIRASDAARLLGTTAGWFHSSAIVGDNQMADASEILRLKNRMFSLDD